MRIALLIIAFFGVVNGASVQPIEKVSVDISDSEAVLTFANTKLKQSPAKLDVTLKALTTPLEKWDEHDQKSVLEVAGLSGDKIQMVTERLFTAVQWKKKKTIEKVASLMILSNEFCYKNKTHANACVGDSEAFLSRVLNEKHLGCLKPHITGIGMHPGRLTGDLSTLEEDSVCECDDQTDFGTYAVILNCMTKAQGNLNKTEELITIINLLGRQPCNGTIQGVVKCQCSQVTEGHEDAYLTLIESCEKVRENIYKNNAIKKYASEKTNIPVARISSDAVRQLIMSQFGNSNPLLLTLLSQDKDSTQTTSEYLKQVMLSAIGVDASLAHILLNNGLSGSDPDKVAMINYLAATGGISPDILPFALKVDNGKDFYLQSLIGSGAVSPVVGLILLGREAGVANDDLMEILINSMVSQDSDNYLSSIHTPYVPGLPAGIYPGSELYFANFELLGVNTCALHDLRNRFECGYNGITAAECELEPYCCYSPVFLTDDKVSEVTGTAIQSASAIPWCYYNVFYVLHDSYFMTVQEAGSFAAPSECKPLFKYGLQIDSVMYAYLDTLTSNPLAAYQNTRVDCGFPGITEFHCVAIRGCCWDESTANIVGVSQCFQKTADALKFDFSKLPAAYVPLAGSCNINRRQIRVLYYKRKACHYPQKFFEYGYNPLTIPNRVDCLARLGCCYEDNQAVVEQFPFVPRCYHRESGGITGLTASDAASLMANKSGQKEQTQNLEMMVKMAADMKKKEAEKKKKEAEMQKTAKDQ